MASFVERIQSFITNTATTLIQVVSVGVDLWNGFVELCEEITDTALTLTVDLLDTGTDWICGLFLLPTVKNAEAPDDLEAAPAVAVEEADVAAYAEYEVESDAIAFDAADTSAAVYEDLYVEADSDVVVDVVDSGDLAVVGTALEVEDAEAFA
ncbi:MAG: hypothetical protein LBP86_12310 [Azoarcus sp.]|jgi:hypothetical protein|nr:hypothetical protein [Azoarcus sp.]